MSAFPRVAIALALAIDPDRTQLRDGRARYLEQALDDLLDHREPRLAEGKALGCALETW
jgi:hypothetical protein